MRTSCYAHQDFSQGKPAVTRVSDKGVVDPFYYAYLSVVLLHGCPA